MTLPTLPQLVIEALRSAGATEEMIAAAIKAGGESRTPHPSPLRKYESGAARQKAYRDRKKRYVTRDEKRDETPPRYVTRDVTRPPDAGRNRFRLPTEALRGRLLEAAQGHIDPMADVEPISALLDQGCDLEADVLPVVARLLSELPRPLKKWGAPWLVRDILAAREQRLAGHRVEDPPPPRRVPPAIEWDEFVGGYRAGLIKWNTARLGPKPGEPGCCAPAEVLREHGFRP